MSNKSQIIMPFFIFIIRIVTFETLAHIQWDKYIPICGNLLIYRNIIIYVINMVESRVKIT